MRVGDDETLGGVRKRFRFADTPLGPESASELWLALLAAVVAHGQLTSWLCRCPGFGEHTLDFLVRGLLRFGLGGCDPGSRQPAVRGNPGIPCPIAVLERPDVPASRIPYVHGTDATTASDIAPAITARSRRFVARSPRQALWFVSGHNEARSGKCAS
jgi:hypothetical protein